MKLNAIVRKNHIENVINLEDGVYDMDIKPKGKAKSYEQVKKLWATATDISLAEYGDTSQKSNIYLKILMMAGIRIDLVAIPEVAFNDFQRKVKAIDIKGREVINHTPMLFCDVCMTGISEMNKQEVSQVIDVAIKWASELGIDTDLERE